MVYKILAINPGSTSTKLSLSEDGCEIRSLNIIHNTEDLHGFSSVMEQEEYRLSLIRDRFLIPHAADLDTLNAIMGRGGLLKPLKGGVYRVNSQMLKDLRAAAYGEHACNLGAVLAERLASEHRKYGSECEALIADPVVVDELCPEARLSGCPEIERKSIFHALNQKSVGRSAGRELGIAYDELKLIIAHMGGGVSVGAHYLGKVIDVNNALDGDGPLSPERSGGLPAGQLIRLVLSGRFSEEDLKKMITGRGGLFAYTGIKDLKLLMQLMDKGDDKAALVYRSMILQISQEISRHGATLKGDIDGIVLTGGLANSGKVIEDLKERISFLAPIFVYPGEREMDALIENAYSALSGKLEVKEYV